MRVARDRGLKGKGNGKQDRVTASRSPPQETETGAAAMVLHSGRSRSSGP
jgi:hypothetical protein